MYTAEKARQGDQRDLDRRIKAAVQDADGGRPNSAYFRAYIEDPWDIREELERRGFKNVIVPSMTLKGDVYFEWGDDDED